ncbi:MAG TPA: Fe-S protein assembly co-chaperone HscB [Bryobacteraceae bacterium]|nr:Fe-S protein assembly co-chaperone HscB [Bryobacteraceae bacterium]
MTYYEFFELPPNLSIDLKDLEKRFYTLSRKWHPDMFARKSEAEKQQSLDATALLNDGYRVLKDPIQRSLYLLKLEGFDIGEQGTKDVPPELLEEVFELNMAIEELKDGDESVRPQLEAAEKKFEGMRSDIDRELETRFAAWDSSRDRNVLNEIRRLLNRRKYITNLINQTHVPDRI